MLTKTRTLTAVQPMLFLGTCCKVTYTDRDDWTAHQKTAHKRTGLKVPTAKPVKLRAVTLTEIEKKWLGKHVTLQVKRWDPEYYANEGRWVTDVVQGYVWCFHHGKTVSITVYDAEKGHNVIETGHLDSLTLA